MKNLVLNKRGESELTYLSNYHVESDQSGA